MTETDAVTAALISAATGYGPGGMKPHIALALAYLEAVRRDVTAQCAAAWPDGLEVAERARELAAAEGFAFVGVETVIARAAGPATVVVVTGADGAPRHHLAVQTALGDTCPIWGLYIAAARGAVAAPGPETAAVADTAQTAEDVQATIERVADGGPA